MVKPYSDEPRKRGASIKQDQINQIFSKYQIPLREDYLRITHIPDYDFLPVIKDAIKSQKHVVFGYSFGRLFKEYDKLAVGHLSLITEICGDNVTILNPGPKNAGYHTFSVDSIYQAVREKADGLWLISRRNDDESLYGHI